MTRSPEASGSDEYVAAWWHRRAFVLGWQTARYSGEGYVGRFLRGLIWTWNGSREWVATKAAPWLIEEGFRDE